LCSHFAISFEFPGSLAGCLFVFQPPSIQPNILALSHTPVNKSGKSGNLAMNQGFVIIAAGFLGSEGSKRIQFLGISNRQL
jgi:hypothetical protein